MISGASVMMAAMISGGIALLAALIGLVIGILAFVFWIWMLISAIQNKGVTEGEKIAWVLVIVLLPFVGSILYFFIGHPKRNAVRTT